MRAVRYTAAGGIVADGDRVLVLLRPSRDEVRLPKGHIEADETPQEAALREVAEESGYTDLEIVADLGMQTIEFDYLGDHVIRDELYYLMHLVSPRQVTRKAKEHQFVPDWLGWDEALSKLSYENEQEWVRRARSASVP
jgi:8-oxo-dGTP pyrophosphatase MutT (NUDIX family)